MTCRNRPGWAGIWSSGISCTRRQGRNGFVRPQPALDGDKISPLIMLSKGKKIQGKLSVIIFMGSITLIIGPIIGRT